MLVPKKRRPAKRPGQPIDPPGSPTAEVHWRKATDAVPKAMKTVLVSSMDSPELVTGYWDGDQWYSTSGDPLNGVKWWCEMPALPVAEREAKH